MSTITKTALTKTLSVSEGRAYFEVIPGEVFEFRCPRRSVLGDHLVMLEAAEKVGEEEAREKKMRIAKFDTSTAMTFCIDMPSTKDALINIAKNMLVDSMIAKHPSANYRKKHMFPNPLVFGWYDSYAMHSQAVGKNTDDEKVANIIYQICLYLYEDIDTHELVASVENWELYRDCIARDGFFCEQINGTKTTRRL